MNFLSSNIQALEKFSTTYPNIRDIFETQPNLAINYLRMCGFKCAEDGKPVTAGNVKFFNYSAKTFCHNCQNNNFSYGN